MKDLTVIELLGLLKINHEELQEQASRYGDCENAFISFTLLQRMHSIITELKTRK